MKHLYLILGFVLFTFYFLPAQDGTLDTNYGDDGITIVPNGGTNAQILDIIKTKDGEILGAGYVTREDIEVIALVRFHNNGMIDSDFGDDGIVSLPLGTRNGRASSMVELVGGKVLVGGWARYGSKDQYVLAKFTSDGELDPSFGTDGISTGSFSTSSYAEDEMAEIQLMSDGKIVIAGKSYNGQLNDGFVAVFNPDGTLDAGFNEKGFRIITWEGTYNKIARSVILDDQDNIYVGGEVSLSFSEEDSFFLTKIKKNGEIDTDFGDGGYLYYSINPFTAALLQVMKFDKDGYIVTGGGAFDQDDLDNNFFLTRYSKEGQLDKSFGNEGVAILPRGSNESIYDMEILPSGDIIAAGSTGGYPSQFAIVRFNSNGEKDNSFGNNGWAITQVQNEFSGINCIAVDESSIIAGGFTLVDSKFSMVTAKYINKNSTGVTSSKWNDTAVSIYPNPASKDINIEISDIPSSDLSVQISDMIGQNITTVNPEVFQSKGTTTLRFDLPDYITSGSYFIHIKSDQGTLTRQIKIVK